MQSPILVMGATGTVGGRVATLLRDAPSPRTLIEFMHSHKEVLGTVRR